MRYFRYTKAAIRNDHARVFDATADRTYTAAFLRGLRAYQKHLDKIADRLGPAAYKFFRFGYAETGLHDGFLLNLSMGDAVGATEGRVPPLRFGQSRSIVRMLVLSYARDTLHSFEFKKLRKVVVDIPSTEPLWFLEGKTIGQVYSYELIAASTKYLRCEWLLDSGGTITVEFEKLSYHRKKVTPRQLRGRLVFLR